MPRGPRTVKAPLPEKQQSGQSSRSRTSWWRASCLIPILILFVACLLAGTDQAASEGVHQTTINWTHGVLECLARCASLSPKSLKAVAALAEKSSTGPNSKNPWRLPRELCNASTRHCDVLHEAFCAALQCTVNASGSLGKWMPLTDAIKAPQPSAQATSALSTMFQAHEKCATRCASQDYLSVEISPGEHDSVILAAEKLTECGVVHLTGHAWPTRTLDMFRQQVSALASMSADEQSGLAMHLRANRTEFFLPFDAELAEAISNSTLTSVMQKYLQEPFALDYVSVLTAIAGISGSQELHSDVAFFPRMSLSAHTALQEITPNMGLTLFCPCSHTISRWHNKTTSHSVNSFPLDIGMAAAVRQASRAISKSIASPCVGVTYVPKGLAPGTLTIYDGAVLHAGLANSASTDRRVLNINFAAPPGYEVIRNYTSRCSNRVQVETAGWRAKCHFS